MPRKTLDDRVKGHVTNGEKPGDKTVLAAEEERSHVQYLIYMADRGFPLTRTMVKALAWAIARRSVKDKAEQGPGEHWWQLFGQCHLILFSERATNLIEIMVKLSMKNHK